MFFSFLYSQWRPWTLASCRHLLPCPCRRPTRGRRAPVDMDAPHAFATCSPALSPHLLSLVSFPCSARAPPRPPPRPSSSPSPRSTTKRSTPIGSAPSTSSPSSPAESSRGGSNRRRHLVFVLDYLHHCRRSPGRFRRLRPAPRHRRVLTRNQGEHRILLGTSRFPFPSRRRAPCATVHTVTAVTVPVVLAGEPAWAGLGAGWLRR